MAQDSSVTKILFIDNDETTFQFRRCMVRVLAQLPPVELYHASDATEGLQLLENLKPDVIVLDEESPEECELFLDSLLDSHPPIMIQAENESAPRKPRGKASVTVIRKLDTLEGVHSTLMLATHLAAKRNPNDPAFS